MKFPVRTAIGGLAIVVAGVIIQPGIGWTQSGGAATPAVKAATPEDPCPAGAASLSSWHFNVNGHNVGNDLNGNPGGNIHSGDTLTAVFTVNPNCGSVRVTLISKSRQKPPHQGGTETLFQKASGIFSGEGSHSLTVQVPPCYFEVDLFASPPSGPNGPPVDSTVGGTNTACQTGGSTTTTSTTVKSTTTTSVPTSVLGTTVVPPAGGTTTTTEPKSSVLAATVTPTTTGSGTLPFTGSGRVLPNLALALGLLVIGGGLTLASHRLRLAPAGAHSKWRRSRS